MVVVDDEPGMARLARALLERTGRFRVVGEAQDGIEAIEAAKRHRPDLVLLDIMMPRMSGLEALPQLVTLEPRPLVFIWSMLSDAATVEKARALGADGCFDKSEDPALLPQRILGAVAGRVEA